MKFEQQKGMLTFSLAHQNHFPSHNTFTSFDHVFATFVGTLQHVFLMEQYKAIAGHCIKSPMCQCTVHAKRRPK